MVGRERHRTGDDHRVGELRGGDPRSVNGNAGHDAVRAGVNQLDAVPAAVAARDPAAEAVDVQGA